MQALNNYARLWPKNWADMQIWPRQFVNVACMRPDGGSGNCFLMLFDIFLGKFLLYLVPKRSVDRVSGECKMLGEQQHRRVVLELPPCAIWWDWWLWSWNMKMWACRVHLPEIKTYDVYGRIKILLVTLGVSVSILSHDKGCGKLYLQVCVSGKRVSSLSVISRVPASQSRNENGHVAVATSKNNSFLSLQWFQNITMLIFYRM